MDHIKQPLVASTAPSVFASPAVNSDPDAAYNENAAATFLSVTVRTLQEWRRLGIGPAYVKVARTVRYQRRALTAFMEAQTVQSIADAKAREISQ